MKKTTTIVLALVLALSMFASFAFVVNPGQGGAYKPEKNPLAITGFFATDNAAILGGARVYAPLANNTDAAYAKNEVIRFAITMDVFNPSVPANGVDAAQLGLNTMFVTSSTVDFTVSNMAGQQALHVPFGTSFVNAINSKVTNNATGSVLPAVDAHGAVVDAKNKMTIKVTTAAGVPSESAFGTASGATMTLNAPTAITEAKASYAFIFTGITKGEITEKGLAKLVTASTTGQAFDAAPDTKLIKVEKNGRTYYVEKVVADQGDIQHPTLTTGLTASPYYTLTKVGYRVYLLGSKTTDGTNDTYALLPVGQFDTESVKWLVGEVGIIDTEVEGLGYSLGLEKLAPAVSTLVVAANAALPSTYAAAPVVAAGTTQVLVFRTVLSDGTVRYVTNAGATAFDATELARLNTMLADFGFSTADNYTYKLEDKYFTTAGADTDVLTATYNNGTVTPVEPEEEGDLDEGTGEEELPEEGDIDEDLDEDGDITDEEEEVPAETGDFSASIAIALAAAAIVAAAALTVVMKKARD